MNHAARHIGALALAAAAAACATELPDEPTWFDDVQPIVRANCARCHGADPREPHLASFRLDRYVANDSQTVDAYDLHTFVVSQAVDLQAPAMPPDYTLSDRQRDILRRWSELGAPKGSRDNLAPRAEVVAPTDATPTVDQRLDLTLRSWDDDGDGLVVAIGVRERGATGGELLVAGLGGGLRSVSLDTGQLASQRHFEVYAVADDGYSDDPADNQHEIVLLPDVLVDHGDRGTAPTVTLLAPNGGDTLLGTVAIAWAASDPDPGDALTIDVELLRVDSNGDEVVDRALATGLANDPPSFSWDPSGVPTDAGGAPIRYKVRVVATDTTGNARSDSSDSSFTIATPGETSATWDDVRPLFVGYCGGCHGEPARSPALEYFRLDKYDADDPEPPANDDLGAYEQRALIYERLVVLGTMPPAARPQPSAAERELIAGWILGGAPRGTSAAR